MNEDKGWISLYRPLTDHWLWDDKPFARGQAWIDILFLANYADRDGIYDGMIIHKKRGDVNLSIRFLARRWGWSDNKVRRFLDLLEKEKMISQKRNTYGTVITVENYNKYQGRTSRDGTPTENGRNTNGTLTETYNKGNKGKERIKKGKEKKIEDFSSVYADAPPELHEAMKAFEEMRLSMKGTPFTENAFRLIMNKVNKLSGGDIGKSIEILNQSVMNSWKGVFELTEEKKQQKGGRLDWLDEITI